MIDKIKCPNCGHDFDVEDALSGKLEAHFKAEYEKKVASQAEKFKAERLVLEKDIEEFEKKKERENDEPLAAVPHSAPRSGRRCRPRCRPRCRT